MIRDLLAATGAALDFNTFVWVLSNLVLATVFVASVAFAVGYPLLFKISTTGGWRIWRAILSIAGFGLLSVIGIFVDPATGSWLELPEGIAWWRPVVRLIIFALIAQSFASLVIYLVQRRFFPQKLQLPPELTGLMESELRQLYGSGAGLPDPRVVAVNLIEAGWTKPGLLAAPENTLGVVPRQLPRRSHN